jgi:hypothetical protein
LSAAAPAAARKTKGECGRLGKQLRTTAADSET